MFYQNVKVDIKHLQLKRCDSLFHMQSSVFCDIGEWCQCGTSDRQVELQRLQKGWIVAIRTKVNPFHTKRKILKLFNLFVKIMQEKSTGTIKSVCAQKRINSLWILSFLFIIKFRYITHTLIGWKSMLYEGIKHGAKAVMPSVNHTMLQWFLRPKFCISGLKIHH